MQQKKKKTKNTNTNKKKKIMQNRKPYNSAQCKTILQSVQIKK